jgi:SAM-dependent methyltransferase
MLQQCAVREVNRYPRLVQTDGRTLPFLDGSFDLVLLFTVLTCVPDDEEQRKLLAEVRRVLRPGGLIYISDLLLNADARNVGRYRRFAGEFGNYGTFRLPEGIVLRHHSEVGIRALLGGFTQLEFQRFAVTTMNGNPADAFQYLGRLA